MPGRVHVVVGETYIGPLEWDDGDWGAMSLAATLWVDNNLVLVDAKGNDASLATLNGLSAPERVAPVLSARAAEGEP